MLQYQEESAFNIIRAPVEWASIFSYLQDFGIVDSENLQIQKIVEVERNMDLLPSNQLKVAIS